MLKFCTRLLIITEFKLLRAKFSLPFFLLPLPSAKILSNSRIQREEKDKEKEGEEKRRRQRQRREEKKRKEGEARKEKRKRQSPRRMERREKRSREAAGSIDRSIKVELLISMLNFNCILMHHIFILNLI